MRRVEDLRAKAPPEAGARAIAARKRDRVLMFYGGQSKVSEADDLSYQTRVFHAKP